jgi:hypothetical protein
MTIRPEVVSLLFSADTGGPLDSWSHDGGRPLTISERELLLSATPAEYEAAADRLRKDLGQLGDGELDALDAGFERLLQLSELPFPAPWVFAESAEILARLRATARDAGGLIAQLVHMAESLVADIRGKAVL